MLQMKFFAVHDDYFLLIAFSAIHSLKKPLTIKQRVHWQRGEGKLAAELLKNLMSYNQRKAFLSRKNGAIKNRTWTDKLELSVSFDGLIWKRSRNASLMSVSLMIRQVLFYSSLIHSDKAEPRSVWPVVNVGMSYLLLCVLEWLLPTSSSSSGTMPCFSYLWIHNVFSPSLSGFFFSTFISTPAKQTYCCTFFSFSFSLVHSLKTHITFLLSLRIKNINERFFASSSSSLSSFILSLESLFPTEQNLHVLNRFAITWWLYWPSKFYPSLLLR